MVCIFVDFKRIRQNVPIHFEKTLNKFIIVIVNNVIIEKQRFQM
ncbi:hypothetical protein [Clostridium pasteurianum]|nr:hypothetical protein [Clostridium pasteurianum]